MPLNRPTPINPPRMHVGNSFRLHWIMAATFAILAEHTGKIGSATRSPIGRKNSLYSNQLRGAVDKFYEFGNSVMNL
jgi:hypothetical protein